MKVTDKREYIAGSAWTYLRVVADKDQFSSASLISTGATQSDCANIGFKKEELEHMLSEMADLRAKLVMDGVISA